MEMERSLAVVQSMGSQKPIYSISELIDAAGSRATAYRILERLQELGLVVETERRGYFAIRSSAFQPYHVLVNLLPSLAALGRARYFGRAYDESDVNRARDLLGGGMVTLDYRAYELTKLQTPYTLYIYAANQNEAANTLRSAGFSEGKKGRVAILPRGYGDTCTRNEIQRVYLDSLAAGGRNTLDAIALDILYGDQLEVKGVFPVEMVLKVREELLP